MSLALVATATSAARADDGGVVRSGGQVLSQGNGAVFSVIPFAGGTELPIRFGEIGVRLDGDVASARSGVVDLGVPGTLAALAIATSPTLDKLGVPAESRSSFKLPDPINADSRGTQSGDRAPFVPQTALGPALASVGGSEQVRAPRGGPALARTVLNPVDLALGAAHIGLYGGVSEATASNNAITVTVRFGEVRFIGTEPAARLSGVEWQLHQVLGGKSETAFSIDAADVGAARYPTGSPGEVATALAAINTAIAGTGVRMLAPVASDGLVSPLRIELRDSALAGAVLGPLYAAALAEPTNQLESSLIEVLPELGAILTVGNLEVGALNGRGGLSLDLGGIDGSIGHAPIEEYRYGALGAADVPKLAVEGSVLADLRAAPPLAPDGSLVLTQPPGSRTTRTVTADPIPGRHAALLVLAGLAALAIVATIDRRRLRAALQSDA